MKKVTAIFIVVVAITLLAGCPMPETDVSPLVGTWTYQSPDDVTVTGTITFTDTTFTQTQDQITLICDYTDNGDSVTTSNCKFGNVEGTFEYTWPFEYTFGYFIDGNTLVFGIAYTRKKGENSLVGVWENVFTLSAEYGEVTFTSTTTITLEFAADNTFTETAVQILGDTFTTTTTCNYMNNGNTVTLSNCTKEGSIGSLSNGTYQYAISGNTLVIGNAYIRQ